MRQLWITLIITITISGCNCGNHSQQSTVQSGISNNLVVSINDTIRIDNNATAVLDIDTVRSKSKFSFGTTLDVDRDHKISVMLILNLNSLDHRIEKRTYEVPEFQPGYSSAEHNHEKEAYVGSEYNPMKGSMVVTKYDSINQDRYLISGSFHFSSYSKKDADTVRVKGVFNQLEYNFYYRDLFYYQDFLE